MHDFRKSCQSGSPLAAWTSSSRTPTHAGQALEIIDRVFDRGDFVGLEVDGQLVAVGAVTSPDPDFWTPAERAQPQAYVGPSWSPVLVRQQSRRMIGMPRSSVGRARPR